MKTRTATILFSLLGAISGACKGPGGEAAPAAPAASAVAATSAAAAPAPAKVDDTGPIKVGILHSLSGTMAISETSLKDVAMMTIDKINASGGVLHRKLEAVV